MDDDETGELAPTEVDADPVSPVDIDDAPLVADLERYQPIKLLGHGGMGEVRLCRDSRISRQVAVKYLGGKLRDDPHFRSRFLLEARVQGQLEHPAIVPVHDLGATPDGDLFFTMKRVRGVTLSEALGAVRRGDGEARFARRRLLTAFSSICLAVDFAHRRGVVHRDLKPGNVMLGDYGEVYILDWGIAKVVHRSDTEPDEAVEVPTTGDAATRAGRVLGTPRYMAPERGEGVAGPRTDIFALGVILGEILDADRADVPPELAAIAARASAPDPEARPASARQLHDAIEAYLDGDRDLAARRKLDEEHAQRAESAFGAAGARADEARSVAAREIGRALGLDPANPRALRTLMRMLTEVPAELPPPAQAEMDRRWQERRLRVVRWGTLATLAMWVLVPGMLWMGVRDWTALAAFIVLVGAASAFQWLEWRRRSAAALPLPALACTLGAIGVMTTSMGLLGVVPAALAIVAMAYRINVSRAVYGVLIFVLTNVALLAPLVLEWTGVIGARYRFEHDALVIIPVMHALPPTATRVYLVLSCAGAFGAAVLYGRMYVNELRRAERQLTFHAWQLQQLLPPEV